MGIFSLSKWYEKNSNLRLGVYHTECGVGDVFGLWIYVSNFAPTIWVIRNSPVSCLCRAPDTSRVRSKMLYASSKDRFKRELDGIQVELQATDPSEMSLDIVKARAI